MDAAKKTDVATPVKVEAAVLAPEALPPDAITNPLPRPGLPPSTVQVCEESPCGAQGTHAKPARPITTRRPLERAHSNTKYKGQ